MTKHVTVWGGFPYTARKTPKVILQHIPLSSSVEALTLEKAQALCCLYGDAKTALAVCLTDAELVEHFFNRRFRPLMVRVVGKTHETMISFLADGGQLAPKPLSHVRGVGTDSLKNMQEFAAVFSTYI